MSELLVYSGGGQVPQPVTSSRNILMVEFMAPYVSPASSGSFRVRPLEGFVATYTSHRKFELKSEEICVVNRDESLGS